MASTRDAPLGTAGFAPVRAWPQVSGVTSTSRRGPALDTSAEQPGGVACAIQSRCTPPFLFNACTRSSVQLHPSHDPLAHPTRTWIAFCSGKPLLNAVTPGWQQPCPCPADPEPSPRLPRTCRSRGGQDAVVPVRCRTGRAEMSFRNDGCSRQAPAYPQRARWAPRRWQPGPAPPLPPHRPAPQEAPRQALPFKARLV